MPPLAHLDLGAAPAARAAAGLLLLGLARTPVAATAPVVVETHVLLQVGAIVVAGGVSKPVGSPQTAEAGPDSPASLRLAVPWRGGEAVVRLDVALDRVPPDGEDAILRCTAGTRVGGAPEVVATRPMRLGDDDAGIFEVYGDASGRILLTLRAERVERPIVRAYAQVGDPVRFLVEVQRVDGDREVTLEANELHTFVGQSVEYSFKRGQDASLENVRLTLLPISVSGDLVTLDAAVSGTLPGSAGPTLLAHHERIAASRRATSAVAATAGHPPAGYRFRVTPDF